MKEGGGGEEGGFFLINTGLLVWGSGNKERVDLHRRFIIKLQHLSCSIKMLFMGRSRRIFVDFGGVVCVGVVGRLFVGEKSGGIIFFGGIKYGDLNFPRGWF